MLTLVTDRTQYHVSLLKKLHAKGYYNMTAAEKASWYAEAAKGAYNYADLNRVEEAVAEISGKLGLNLTTKTNWSMWDIPVKAEMERYLRNVARIKEYCATYVDISGFPTLPDSMAGLDYHGANAIEMVLSLVYEMIDQLPTTSAVFCGDIYCGEV